MKLSVVIPVYRVEATLDQCVESVLDQHVDEMEVILVDDGSPDHCPQLCDAWRLRDSRVKVIHKVNGGLSDARNAGIAQSTGTYITFVDSDDFVATDTYPALIAFIDEHPRCDLLEYAIDQRLMLNDAVYDQVDDYWTDTKAYTHTYACNKVYRRQLFDQVAYPKGKVFEDVYTLPLLLRQCRQVATTSHGTYHYCYNPKGITAQADGQQLAMLLNAHLNNGMPMDDEYYMHLLNIQIDVWERTGNALRLPFRKVALQGLSVSQKAKAIVQNILGINILCRIIRFIHHFRAPSRW